MSIIDQKNSSSDGFYLSMSPMQATCSNCTNTWDSESISQTGNDFYNNLQEARPLIDFKDYFKHIPQTQHVQFNLFQQYECGYYKGQSQNFKRWGRGTFYFASGEVIEGHFVNDQPVGRCNFTTKDGRKLDAINLEGKWEFYKKVRQINGIGVRKKGNLIYIGNLKQGDFHGKGKLYSKFKSYKGYFNEFFHGAGVFRNCDGVIQAGEFFQVNFQGLGTLKCSDGTSFIGQYILNQPWGVGYRITQYGISRGYYINGKKEGWFTINNGSRFYYIKDQNTKVIINNRERMYVGDMINSQKNRFGTFCINNNLDIQSGQFRNGLLDGFGVIITNNMKNMIEGQFIKGIIPYGKITHGNQIYYGQLVNGLKQGFGFIKGLNFTYEGQFFEDQYHGYGSLKSHENEYKGEWKNGKYYGDGKFVNLISPNCGESYLGYWVEDQKHGKGKFRAPQGLTYDGDWKYDQIDGHGTWEDLTLQIKYKGYCKGNQINGLGRVYFDDLTIYAYYSKLNQQLFPIPNLKVFLSLSYSNASIIKAEFGKYLGQVNMVWLNGQGSQTYNDQLNIGNFIKGDREGFCQVLKTSTKCFCSFSQSSQLHECNELYRVKGQFIKNELVSGLMQKDAFKYIGQFFDFNFEGFGTVITSDGNLQIGQFRAGKLDGHGIEYYQQDQVLIEGCFKLGRRIGNSKHLMQDVTDLYQNEAFNGYKQSGAPIRCVGIYLNTEIEQATLIIDTELYQGNISSLLTKNRAAK